MSLTLTKEKHFALLLSIYELSGVATKQKVLDNIQNNNYVSFTSEDLEIKTNRPELHWRNDFAFIRKHLVDHDYIDDSKYNQWEITQDGIDYLFSLCKSIMKSSGENFQRLTENSIKRAMEILGDFDKSRNELVEDQMTMPNETQELFVRRIKRYKKIVDDLKEEYNARCQIENCGFTFVKSNGENYAEGHHLVPLAKGGDQDKKNLVILCANHHRMFHYADIQIRKAETNKREVIINGIVENILYKD